jgi:hypothetical protein
VEAYETWRHRPDLSPHVAALEARARAAKAMKDDDALSAHTVQVDPLCVVPGEVRSAWCCIGGRVALRRTCSGGPHQGALHQAPSTKHQARMQIEFHGKWEGLVKDKFAMAALRTRGWSEEDIRQQQRWDAKARKEAEMEAARGAAAAACETGGPMCAGLLGCTAVLHVAQRCLAYLMVPMPPCTTL